MGRCRAAGWWICQMRRGSWVRFNAPAGLFRQSPKKTRIPRQARSGLAKSAVFSILRECLASNPHTTKERSQQLPAMESECSDPAGVKQFGRKSHRLTGRFSTLESGDKRTIQAFLRILGYIDGAFLKSHRRIHYLAWHAPRFSKKSHSQGKAGYSVRSLERIFPRFQRWCTEYEFERRNIGGRWCVLIWPNNSVLRGVSGKNARERLILAIRSHVAKGGRAHVDREFIRKFSEISLLSLNLIESLWAGLRPRDLMTGDGPPLKARWRGVGRGRKFVVHDAAREAQICEERKMPAGENSGGSQGENLSSDPQSLPPVSISFGNDKIKASAAGPHLPEDRPLAALAKGNASGASLGGLGSPSKPQTALKHAVFPPGFVRSPSALAPVQFCGRFISMRKLSALAVWLAVARLKFAHQSRDRVVWRFAHARNFAFRSLRFGYTATAIEAAYCVGLQRSHEDALDADRLPGGGYASQREPSAAVVYAWLHLRGADPRESEELWSVFFASDRVRLKAAGVSRRTPDPARGAAPRFTAAQAVDKLRELRATVQRVQDRSRDEWPEGLTAGELAAFLKTRLTTLAEFSALPWRDRVAIVRRAAEWKTRR